MSAPAVATPPATPERRADPSISLAAAAGSIGFLVAVALSFVITPYIIRSLGDARYGTWALIAQVTGYYGLLDFGVRAAVGHYTASLLATEDDAEVSRLAASAFWALCGVALVALVLGAVLMVGFPSWFRTGGVDQGELRGAIAVVSIAVALTLPFDVFGAMVNGCRRPDIVHGVDITLRILKSVAIVVALAQGGGLVALAGVMLAGKVVDWTALAVVTRRFIPTISLDPRLFDREWLRKVLGYGSRNFVINISLAVIHRLDYVLIGSFLGVRFVTFYSIGKMMTGYVSQACSNVTRAFTMHFAHLNARGEHERLRELYLTGVRLSGLLGALLTGYVLVFGSSFVRLWLGPSYVEGPWTQRTDVVLAILLVGQAPRLLQSISWQLLFGTRRVRFLMWLQLAEAAANLLLSLALVRPLGLAGVALGTFVPLLVSNLVFLPRYVNREIGLSHREYLRRGIGRPLAVTALVMAASAALVVGVPIDGWRSFVAEAAAAALLGGVVSYLLVLTADERRLVRRRVPFLRPA